jgi:hypothetical protein
MIVDVLVILAGLVLLQVVDLAEALATHLIER